MRRLIAVAIVLIAALSIEAAEGRTARVLDYRQLDALNGWTLLEAGLFRTADGGTELAAHHSGRRSRIRDRRRCFS